MNFLYLALFAISILGLVYLVRSMRALHIKVGKQSDRLAAGIQKVTEQTRNNSLNDYRQLEAYVQLQNLIKFTAPLPPTRGWAGSPDLLVTLAHVVKTFKPGATAKALSVITCSTPPRHLKCHLWRNSWSLTLAPLSPQRTT